MSLQGSETIEAISKGTENGEIAALPFPLLAGLAMTKRDYDTISLGERGMLYFHVL